MNQQFQANSIEIRQLEVSDLDSVMEIEPVAFGTHHWSHQSFVNELLNPIGHYFAAIEAETGRLVGYSGFWLIAKEEAHITTLATLPDLCRKGIGERLLVNNIIVGRTVGANWLTLEVRKSNEKAFNLYNKYGFRILGELRHYYKDNDEDALVLWTDSLDSAEFVERFRQRLESLQFKSAEEIESLLWQARVENDKKTVELLPDALRKK